MLEDGGVGEHEADRRPQGDEDGAGDADAQPRYPANGGVGKLTDGFEVGFEHVASASPFVDKSNRPALAARGAPGILPGLVRRQGGKPVTAARYDVIGIGNAIVDVVAHADDAFVATHGLAKGVMTLIDADTAKVLYDAMAPAVECSGGSAANTIAGLASLGVRAAFIGKVRDDQLGGIFRHDIRALGVAFETAPATGGAPTARCLIFVTKDAQRTMQTYLGASVELGPGDIDEEWVAAARMTYLEGYLWDRRSAKQAFVKAATVARQAGRAVALSLSDPFCVDRHRGDFRDLVNDHIDILFANEEEIKSPLPGGHLRRRHSARARPLPHRRPDPRRHGLGGHFRR